MTPSFLFSEISADVKGLVEKPNVTYYDMIDVFEATEKLQREIWERYISDLPQMENSCLYDVYDIEESRALIQEYREAINAIKNSVLSISLSSTLFDSIGTRILKCNPSIDDLAFLIENVESLRDEAWSRILKLEPDDETLFDLLYRKGEFVDLVLGIIEERGCDKNDILLIINHGEDKWYSTREAVGFHNHSEAACEMLKEVCDDIGYITYKAISLLYDDMNNTDYLALAIVLADNAKNRVYPGLYSYFLFERFIKEATECLLTKNPNNDQLCFVMGALEDSLQEEVGKLVFLNSPNTDDLCHVIRYVDSLRNDAWNQLLEREPDNYNLRYVIHHVDSLRDEAWDLLLKQNPSEDDLCYISRYIFSLREKSDSLL